MNIVLFLVQDSLATDSLALALQEEQITFFDLMVEGGILMIPILIFFLISIYVIVERWSALTRSHTETERFLGSI